MHNQPEQEESQPVGQINKSSNTLYYIKFMVGLLVIITGYIVIQTIYDFVGLWAPIVIIAIVSIAIARKL